MTEPSSPIASQPPTPRSGRARRAPARAEEGREFLVTLIEQGVLLSLGAFNPADERARAARERFLAARADYDGSDVLGLLDRLLAASQVGAESGYGRILRGSARTFAQHGFDPVRIDDLLAASGVSARTFYQFFASKHEVLGALYELLVQVMVDCTRVGLSLGKPDDGGFELRLAGFARGLVDGVALSSPLIQVTLAEALRPGTVLAERFHVHAQQISEALRPHFEARVGGPIDARWLVTRVGVITGLILTLGVDEHSTDDERKDAASLIVDALQPKPAA